MMSDLAITGREGRVVSFYLMLGLSVVVAVMGLSANSAAVVIGAMLLAPLMTPVLATAASLAMGLFAKAFGSATTVVVATVASIALSYVLAWAFVPDGPLSAEIIARTRPDIRDLVVALGAGVAGSYATIHPDASASLPGVAVAVALVPPLATIGIALETGQSSYVQGAALLYFTNLVAIIVASLLVFVVTGFVPARRLATRSRGIGFATIAVLAVLGAVAWPLYESSRAIVADSHRQSDAEAVIDEWLGDSSVNRVVDLSRIDEGRVLVSVESPEPPRDDAPVREEFGLRYGAELTVLWDRIEFAQITTTTTILTDEERHEATIRSAVTAWLAVNGAGLSYRLDGVGLTDEVWRIEVSGVGDTPDFAGLNALLDDEVGSVNPYLFYWSSRTRVDPLATTTTSPLQVQQEQMRAETRQWAETNGLELVGFVADPDRIQVDVAGLVEPPIEPLLASLAPISDAPVSVRFSQRTALTTSTTEAEETSDDGDGGAATTSTTS